jgi:hypothetical protein
MSAGYLYMWDATALTYRCLSVSGGALVIV